jgi:hypothetical protein
LSYLLLVHVDLIASFSEYKNKSLKKIALKNYADNDCRPEMFPKPKDPPHGLRFEAGMKLEAIDPLNLSSICVATVMKVNHDLSELQCKTKASHKKIVGHPFSRPFQLAWPWQMENVKGIFEGTRSIREGTTAIGLGALAYV